MNTAKAQRAQVDCGMAWLRDVTLASGQPFAGVTQKIVPVLSREVAVAQGDDRKPLIDALPVDDAIATIAWLQPLDALPKDRQPLWHLCASAYLVAAGRYAEADEIIKRTLGASSSTYLNSREERWALEQLARFKDK